MKTKNSNVREVRTLAATDLRSVTGADGKHYLEGYAARYNVRSSNLGWFYEILAPGAFTRALSEGQDVRHLVNHDASLLLGRTKSGTTQLSEDEKGLKFRTELPDTQLARDLMVSVGRGDINECSFGFICRKATWIEETDENGSVTDVRQVEDVDLFDVSTVTYPAYPETNTQLAMRALFPEGMPEEIRAKHTLRDSGESTEGTGTAGDDGTLVCDCNCSECQDGRCADCSDDDCHCEACLHDFNSIRTKPCDGELLPMGAFLIVGNASDIKTWKHPIKFSTEEKTKRHVSNTLARFPKIEAPEDVLAKAWTRLVIAAKECGIAVGTPESEAFNAAVADAELAAKRAFLKVRAIKASL